MSRKKLSEYRAKTIIFDAIGQKYEGVSLDFHTEDWRNKLQQLDRSNKYVIKVDQAEKGRYKKGLVKLDRSPDELEQDASEYFQQGFHYLLVEAYDQHEQADERYLTVARTREGNVVAYANVGGIDIESHSDSIKSGIYNGEALEGLDMPQDDLNALVKVFDDNYFSFLEINPYTVSEGKTKILDAAVEVDDEASFFEDAWTNEDIRSPRAGAMSPEEEVVNELSHNSQASFSLEVLNPDGAVWVLLSGGGASVMVADEVHNLGLGEQLANYGEYSGNPNTEETRLYTEQVISLLLKSKAPQKVLLIAGGVANFTDVKQTFKGIIEAFSHHIDELKSQPVKICVRRGGPNQDEGLAMMRDYLKQAGIPGEVDGPEVMLSEIVARAVEGIKE